MKLKRARWTTAARSRCESVPKKMVAPKMRWKASDQPTILRAALLHAERVQHLRCASKVNRLALLPDRQRRQENGNESILSPGQTVARMPGDLKRELAVAPFMKNGRAPAF